MAKPKRKPAQDETPRSLDRHKPRRMVGIRENFASLLDIVCVRHSTDVTEETNRAVREYLEKLNLWPPPPDGK